MQIFFHHGELGGAIPSRIEGELKGGTLPLRETTLPSLNLDVVLEV